MVFDPSIGRGTQFRKGWALQPEHDGGRVHTHSADADRSAALVLEQAIFGDLFQNCSKLGTWNKNAAAN